MPADRHARRRAETITQMNRALAAMDAADQEGNQLAYSRADALFHEAIVENSANAFVVEAYKLVSGRVGALRSHNLFRTDELRTKSTGAHRTIARAFERSDLKQAEEIMDEHVSRMSFAFRSVVRRGLPVTLGRRPVRAAGRG